MFTRVRWEKLARRQIGLDARNQRLPAEGVNPGAPIATDAHEVIDAHLRGEAYRPLPTRRRRHLLVGSQRDFDKAANVDALKIRYESYTKPKTAPD